MKSLRVEIRVPPADLTRWRVTAAALGLDLSEFIRRTCNLATMPARAEIDAIIASRKETTTP